MNNDTRSLWALPDPTPSDPPLAQDTSCDVCVVGAGIAGLTAAYLFARDGKKVVVLDAKPAVGTGETERTTAHLAWYPDPTFTRLAAVRGDDVAGVAAASHRAAIDLIGDIARAEGIACDYARVDGYLFPGADGPAVLDAEEQALRRLGLPYERAHVTFPGGQTSPALRFADHARFHPTKYLAGLAAALRARGGVVHAGTVVEKVRGGAPAVVTTAHGHAVSAGTVVVATNNPFEGGTTLHNKVAAYTTYALAADVPKGAVADALYWDTDDPYHYARVQPGDAGAAFDTLVVGGEDHKTGQAADQADRWARLEAWARARVPGMEAVRSHWSGQVFETPDGLGLIGPAPWNGPNVFVVTGDSGMGLTHGTLGARLVADLAAGRASAWAAAYSPSRLMPGALRTLLGENLNVAAQFAAWVTGGDVKSADDIPPGQGAVVRRGLTKLAVYKDEGGAVTTRSAVCPHMGCVVRWNPGEKTWDCPCHGSRFGPTGTCLHGPATSDLAGAD